jgi:ribosomal protein L40E
MELSVPVNDTKRLLCAAVNPKTAEECGGAVFLQTFQVRSVSPLLSPTGQSLLVQVPEGMVCMKCGTRLDQSRAKHVGPSEEPAEHSSKEGEDPCRK